MILHNIVQILSHSIPGNEAGPQRRCGQGNSACGSDAGHVAMVLSPGMSAKFPRNAGLQGSRKQCTNNKINIALGSTY